MYQTATAGRVWLHSPRRLPYLVLGGMIATGDRPDALTQRLSEHYTCLPQIGGRRMFLLDEPGDGAALLFGFDGPADPSGDPGLHPGAPGMEAALILLGRYRAEPACSHVAAGFAAWLQLHTRQLIHKAGIQLSLTSLGAELAGHAG